MDLIDERTVAHAAAAVYTISEQAGDLFSTCFRNTLERAVTIQADGTAFVVTGDIPAMWLRDSTTQLAPYLHFLRADERLSDTVAAVSKRQLACLRHDPYANAFNERDNGRGHQDDLSGQDGWVWERKYELDSLCYPIQLAYDLWRLTGRTDHLVGLPAVADVVLTVIRTEQQHERDSEYRFQRFDCPPSDTLLREGRGRLTNPVGLSWSAFRPSDDACELGYNIPGNAFAVVALRNLAEMIAAVHSDHDRSSAAASLAGELDDAIRRHGIVASPDHGAHLAYEVDGFGDAVLMDDANVPSLLSLPLLGWCTEDDPLYRATRAFVLSPANPYRYAGTAAAGIGSPHTPRDHVWPIALAVQGLTDQDPAEKRRILDLIVATDAGTGLVHESFHKDDPRIFTRPWFSWANAMYCELALDVAGLRSYRRGPVEIGATS